MREWKEVQVFFEDRGAGPEKVCEKRTRYAMQWYIRKANWNKWVYYVLTTISIVCPLLNAIAAVVCTGKLASLILASVTTLAASILGMTNAHAKWDNYRSAAEYLKSEYVLFQAGAEPYSDCSSNGCRAKEYLKNIEEYMRQTHIEWRKEFYRDDGNEGKNEGEKEEKEP